MTIRTRFAPSPTGYLHVGGARTALYGWLYARKQRGTFILRIEDTDRERSTEESVQAILDGLDWLGLDYDEGPFYQTERFERYKEVIQQLLTEKKAYRCVCSKERLDTLRKEQLLHKQKPRYDGRCRNADIPETQTPFVVRFRNPKEGSIVFDDQVYGEIEINNRELDDLIIARSDGVPTYNLTVVVDDMDMQITHVIRGDDHINNTPRQINILKALGVKVPVYAHLPMILGEDNKRLSKRHGAVGVMQYRDAGFLPEALLNYLVRLGWSYGDQEIFSIDEMIQHFDIKDINKGASAFNQAKLLWLNQHYIKTNEPEKIAKQLIWHFEKLNIPLEEGPELSDVVKAQGERCKTLVEMVEKSRFFYEEFFNYDERAAKKHFKKSILPALFMVYEKLQKLDEWEEELMHQIIIETAEHFELKLGMLAQPIRLAVTGGTVSPPIDTTLFLIGRERVLKRLADALHYIEKQK